MILPDPETAAHQLLAKAGASAPPTDLNAVLDLWPRLRVTETELDGEGIFLDRGRGVGEIFIRHDIAPRRKRFTLAHELGHFVLLEIVRDQGNLLQDDHDAIERWCNRFAAYLLLPKEWVMKYLSEMRFETLIEGILRGPAFFDVSNQAFRMQIAAAAPLSIFTISCQNGTLKLCESIESNNAPLSWDINFLNIIARDKVRPTWKQQAAHVGKNRLLVKWITKTATEQRCVAALIPETSARSLAA